MSYARFADDSDVYVFLACDGHLECCSCNLKSDGRCASFKTTAGMLAHLDEHRRAGHDVPDGTLVRLREDQEENDAYVAFVGAGGDGNAFEFAAP